MYNYNAKIVRWIDGGTILLDIDMGFFVTRHECIRLARINVPEMNDEKPYLVRKAKHARYIAEVIFNGKNISDFLIKNDCVEKVDF